MALATTPVTTTVPVAAAAASGYITPAAVASYVGTGVQSGNGEVVITGFSGAATATSLVSSLNPSDAGQQVTYTATVSPVPDAGTVMFTDGDVPVTGCSAQSIDPSTGVATCTVTYNAIGSHSIVAAYSGDTNYLASSSSPTSQTVLVAASTSTAVTSSSNPSQVTAQVTYSATVSPVPDGGTVAFSDGGGAVSGCTAQGISPSTGVATCTVTYSATGSHSIVAAYSGDTSFPASTSPTLTQVVDLVNTSTAIASTENPSDLGQQVTYTATVTPAPDGGTVAFSDGGQPISGCGAQAVDTSTGTATCSAVYVAPGSHPITAVYSGDASYGPSTASVLTETVADQ
ncbi:MAG: Ig-like domain-containing protein, partial [Acidimicrobiales bacterium]